MNKNTLFTYSSFALTFIVVVLSFITATNYAQLSVAIITYPLIVWLAHKAFYSHDMYANNALLGVHQGAAVISKMSFDITDRDKRAFLKLIGATSVSLLLYSILSKRPQFFLQKGTLGSESPLLTDITGRKTPSQDPSPINEYKITELDDDVITYYGFLHQQGHWYIMKQDTIKGTFRYTRGNSDFSKYWANRTKLTYTYFDKIF